MRKSIKKSLIFFSLLIVIMLSTVLILPSMLFADTTTLDAIPGTGYGAYTFGNIQFTFDLTGIIISSIQSANLKIWANDVESYTDNVAFNGTTVGQLTFGGIGINSLSEFNVLNFLTNGINTVVVTPDSSPDVITVYQSELVIETVSGNISAAAPRTPQDWVLMDLNINQLLDLYGATTEGFIKMLYDIILNRVPDDKGLSDWITALNNGMTASEVVHYMVFSDELNAKISSMGSEEFISFLYNQVIDRNPDTDGYNSWTSFMAAGNSKSDTLKAFLNNEEWINICEMFNVTP